MTNKLTYEFSVSHQATVSGPQTSVDSQLFINGVKTLRGSSDPRALFTILEDPRVYDPNPDYINLWTCTCGVAGCAGINPVYFMRGSDDIVLQIPDHIVGEPETFNSKPLKVTRASIIETLESAISRLEEIEKEGHKDVSTDFGVFPWYEDHLAFEEYVLELRETFNELIKQ